MFYSAINFLVDARLGNFGTNCPIFRLSMPIKKWVWARARALPRRTHSAAGIAWEESQVHGGERQPTHSPVVGKLVKEWSRGTSLFGGTRLGAGVFFARARTTATPPLPSGKRVQEGNPSSQAIGCMVKKVITKTSHRENETHTPGDRIGEQRKLSLLRVQNAGLKYG